MGYHQCKKCRAVVKAEMNEKGCPGSIEGCGKGASRLLTSYGMREVV